MLLERGKMLRIGEPAAIARAYRAINFGRFVHQAPDTPDEQGSLDAGAAAEIAGAWFENPSGEQITAVAHGDPCVACIKVRFNEPLENPIFGITLRNDTGATVFATSTALSHTDTGRFERGQTVVVRMRFENWLTAARYNLTPSVARSGTGDATLDLHEDMATILVHGWHFTGGVTNLPHGFEVDSQ
jgi:hypothetical protein